MLICLVVGCQKAELVEKDSPKDGRNAPEEKSESINLTPTIDTKGWEGTIDVGFDFG